MQRKMQRVAILVALALLLAAYYREFGFDLSWGVKPGEWKYVGVLAALVIAAFLFGRGK